MIPDSARSPLTGGVRRANASTKSYYNHTTEERIEMDGQVGDKPVGGENYSQRG